MTRTAERVLLAGVAFAAGIAYTMTLPHILERIIRPARPLL